MPRQEVSPYAKGKLPRVAEVVYAREFSAFCRRYGVQRGRQVFYGWLRRVVPDGRTVRIERRPFPLALVKQAVRRGDIEERLSRRPPARRRNAGSGRAAFERAAARERRALEFVRDLPEGPGRAAVGRRVARLGRGTESARRRWAREVGADGRSASSNPRGLRGHKPGCRCVGCSPATRARGQAALGRRPARNPRSAGRPAGGFEVVRAASRFGPGMVVGFAATRAEAQRLAREFAGQGRDAGYGGALRFGVRRASSSSQANPRRGSGRGLGGRVLKKGELGRGARHPRVRAFKASLDEWGTTYQDEPDENEWPYGERVAGSGAHERAERSRGATNPRKVAGKCGGSRGHKPGCRCVGCSPATRARGKAALERWQASRGRASR